MVYGHLTAATVMTLGVCQGHSLIASFLARNVIYASVHLSVTEVH